jgi:phenylalanyl-tRNA synthetase beta chain
MKASVRWLRELCPQLPNDANALAARFTAAGLEVEAVLPFGLAAEACLVAAVVGSRPHPSRSGLRLVTVDRGSGTQEVVCGAPNVPEPGGLVVLAPLGTQLPAAGVTIERRSIAGVASEGMLCSEEELGLSDRADGILVLPPASAAPGTTLAAAFPSARDDVLELSLTPNRADGLGHLGLAREAAALFEVPFAPRPPNPPEATDRGRLEKYTSVTIDDADRCPHYGAAAMVDAKIAPSPLGVRWRLAALGVRSISNVVDVTNWVMLEFGHPMHAFDLDRVRGGRIVVRCAREGEKLSTLDGVDRALSTDDLVICDAEGPVALAGVMGGATSEISTSTRRVLLECAYFEPRGIRRAARRHGLHTESSHRFERGVDFGDTATVLARAAEFITELAGAAVVAPPRIFEARPLPRTTVSLRHDRVRALLGAEVDRGDAGVILDRLGFERRASQPGIDAWEVPSHRPDVSREVDLIEEVARVRGYDAIPTVLPAVVASRDHGPRQALARRVRSAATAMGLSEAVTWAFVSPGELDAVGAPPPGIALRNPLREEQSVMRTSLVPGLLKVVAHARRHGERDARLFSVGTLFARSGRAPNEEHLGFAALLAGERPSWLGKPQPVDVWDAKGLAEGLTRRLVGRELSLVPDGDHARSKLLHPRGAAAVEIAGKRVGALGPLHPEVAARFEVGESAVVVELDLDELERVEISPRGFMALPRFPANLRDIAVVVKEEVTAGEIERAVREAAGDLAERVTLFDRFAGGHIAAGHTSFALRVVYRARDRTLTDAEVDARHAEVVARVQQQFGGQLRA